MPSTGTILICRVCGNETRRNMVHVSYLNDLRDYVRAAAGDESVLLPVSTLNAIAERAESAERALLTALVFARIMC